MLNTEQFVRFFTLGFSRAVWWVEQSPQSRLTGCSAFSPFNEKCCAGSRLGTMFSNSSLVPNTTLFPWREARERKKDAQSDWQGVKANILLLTATFTIWLLCMRKNPFRNLDTETHNETQTISMGLHTYHAHKHTWIIKPVTTLTVLISSSLKNS